MASMTEPPVIPNLSLPVPNRNVPELFSERMDRTLLEIPFTVDGINLTVRWTYDTAQIVSGFSQAAAQSVQEAAQQVGLAKKEVVVAKSEAQKAATSAQQSAKSASQSEQARVDVKELIDAFAGDLGVSDETVEGAALQRTATGVAFSNQPLGRWAFSDSVPLREVAANTTALPYQRLGVNTKAATRTVTLPTQPVAGMWVALYDPLGTWDIHHVVLARNSQRIMGLAEDMVVDVLGQGFTLTFIDATRGWVITA